MSKQIEAVVVKDNQRVRKGQLLFRIDPQPYQVDVALATTQLA